MARIAGLLLVGLVFVGGATPIASAEDPASAERIAALERKVGARGDRRLAEGKPGEDRSLIRRRRY